MASAGDIDSMNLIIYWTLVVWNNITFHTIKCNIILGEALKLCYLTSIMLNKSTSQERKVVLWINSVNQSVYFKYAHLQQLINNFYWMNIEWIS